MSKSQQQTKRERKEEARRARADALKAAKRRQAYRRIAYAAAAAAVVIVVVVVMITLGGSGGNPSTPGSVTVDGPARSAPLKTGDMVPNFSAPALAGGGDVSWGDYAGQKTVLSVWAPWCPHCQVELPVLSKVMAEYPDVKLVTIVTAIGREPGPSPEQYMKDKGLSFPVAVDDGQGTLANALGIQGFPTLYFVNSDGTVSQEQEGEVAEADLRQLIQGLT